MRHRDRVLIGALCMAVYGTHPAVAEPTLFVSAGTGFGRGGSQGTPSQVFDADANLVSRSDHYPTMGQGFAVLGGAEWSLSPDARVRGFVAYRRPEDQGYAVVAPGDYFNPENSESTTATMWQGGVTLVAARHAGRVDSYLGVGASVAFLSARTTFVYNRFGDIVTAHLASAFHPAIGAHGMIGATLRTRGPAAPFAEVAFEQMSFAQRTLTVKDASAFGQPFPLDVDASADGVQTVLEYAKNDIAHPAPPIAQASSVTLRAGIRVAL